MIPIIELSYAYLLPASVMFGAVYLWFRLRRKAFEWFLQDAVLFIWPCVIWFLLLKNVPVHKNVRNLNELFYLGAASGAVFGVRAYLASRHPARARAFAMLSIGLMTAAVVLVYFLTPALPD